jgi:hypothetical protein
MQHHSTKRGLVALAAAAVLSIGLAGPARAQFIPYYGKNKVTYDSFSWRIYVSPHFRVYYYPEFEQHLSRLVSYLESAYQHVSSELKHEIPFSIPVIFYKTHSEFEQTNLYPEFIPEGVAAFAEPVRDRMVMPIDQPPAQMQGLITHELTHIFEFDLVPRSLLRRSAPLWVDEGLADYMRGTWDPLDLMQIRDAAISDNVPKLSKVEFAPFSGRLVYNMGHAAFEFIEDRYGKEGIRQFMYTLRKGVMGGGIDDVYRQAFRISPEDFDRAFDKWLKERFKPYRDKERPEDYGPNLAPNPEISSLTQVFGFMPSPSGELVAAFSGNRSDGELDVVLLSAEDGKVVKNLSGGFTGQYESLSMSDNFIAGRSLDFSPGGDLIAFFARSGKRRALFLMSPVDGRVVKKLPMSLDQATSPCLLPDGRHAIISAIQGGVSDLFLLDLETGTSKNLTQDAFYDSDPRVSADGQTVVYTRNISGYNKIYTFPLADPSQRTQLTFGTFDDLTPVFSPDGNKLYYASNEDDEIFNIRSLDLRTGVIRQYTDVLGGNVAPAPLPRKEGDKIAFISYYKGEYVLHAIETGEPLKEADQEVLVASEEVVDFQPDVTHQVITENKRRKRLFEGLYLEGRPPLNIGVTSGGDFFGGTQVALTDVLGDQDITLTAASIREFRTYAGTYTNRSGRLHWGASVFDNTYFFYDNSYAPTYSYDFREGLFFTQRTTGGLAFAEYPLDKYRRLTVSGGLLNVSEGYDDPAVQAQVEEQYRQAGLSLPFANGLMMPLSVRLTQETTRFQDVGPLDGSTFSIGVEFAPPLGDSVSRTTVTADLRKYLRLGPTTSLLAMRVNGFHSTGNNPDYFYFGGNHTLRGFGYNSIAGNQGFYANVELRLPAIYLLATPLGLLGPVRGSVYAGIGGAKYNEQPYTFSSSEPGTSYVNYDPEDPTTWFGEPVDGFHLVDGRASFGFGLQIFFLGYPMHFDWSKFTDLNVVSDRWEFDFWIGFDF